MNKTFQRSSYKIISSILAGVCAISISGCGLDDFEDDTDYDQIYQSGYDDGYNEAYQSGYDEGYEAGYNDGSLEAAEEDSWDNWDDDEYNVWDDDDYYDEDDDQWGGRGYEDYAYDDDEYYEPYESTGGTGVFKNDNGSSDTLTGNIPVISIYVNDANYTWGDSKKDNKTYSHTYEYLGIACDFLMEEASKWDKELNLIYDYYEDEDLGYTLTIEADAVEDYYSADCEIWYFIENSIDVGAIQKRYDADSIAIMVFINTDKSIEEVSCTTCYYGRYALDSVYEFSYMFMHSNYEEETPAAFAHEMMHQFGAIDLYQADDDIGMSEEEVAIIESDYPNDIMYTTYDEVTWIPIYDEITNEISELDAYYIGWTDHADLVDEFKLQKRLH